MTDEQSVLTREGFQAWLESLPPRKSPGARCKRDDCPLARFLKARGAENPACERLLIG
jgi:hypothetical protein